VLGYKHSNDSCKLIQLLGLVGPEIVPAFAKRF